MLPSSLAGVCDAVALATRVLSVALPIADLQGYGQNARTQFSQLIFGARTCAKVPAVIVTGAEVGILLLLICVTVLLVRGRRETRKFREELANLLSLRQAIESADRTNAEFIASMIPQIRTPMNALVGFVDLALKADLDPELREHLDTVRTSADWLMHIENDALAFSCIETDGLTLDTAPFSISECILSAMKIVEREASAKELITVCKIDPLLPEVVRGDPTRFRHVIFNLLDYAVRHSANGSIVLSTALESNSADNVLVRVAITDTDGGIPAAKRPLILEPFRHADVSAALRSDPAGFGLVISRRLVDLMGGTMEFRSQLGTGSTVEFTVRFQKQATSAEPAAPVHAPEGLELKKLSILVAEDNALNRRLITRVLESAGHRVWTATNGIEAAHTFQTEGFDVVFMDVEMPDMDGLETTRAIRAAEAPNLRVPIYALTAHALPEDRDKCIAAGMDGFITKPIAADEVLQLISKLAAGVIDIQEPQIDVDQEETPVAESTGSGTTHENTTDAIEPEDAALPPEEFELEITAAGDTYSLASVAGTETNGFFRHTELAGNADADEIFESAIERAIGAVVADEVMAADDSGPDTNAPLSAPAGLALLEAASQVTQPSPAPVYQDGSHTLAAGRDPFEEARKSLSKSSFGIRAIHNDGDPSDRNLI